MSVAGDRAAATRRSPWLITLLCIVQFILVVDTTIVVVSLPSIAHDLHFDQENLQWIITVYALTFGGFLMVGGRAADLFGRRELLIAGLVVFVGSSMVCALAQNEAMLLIARAVQGLGGAMASPAALSLLTATFHEGIARNRALGMWSAVGQGGSIAGNILGGVLTSTAGWRWIFLVNVPICTAAVIGTILLIEKSPRGKRQALDLPGALTVTTGVGLLIFAFSEVETKGFGNPETIAAICGSAAFLAAFIAIEKRVSNPLVPLAIFRGRLAIGNLLVILGGPTIMGAYIFMSLYLQGVAGYSAIHTGFGFAPWAAAVGLSSIVVSRKIARYGVRLVTPIGYLLTIGGLLLMMRIGPTGNYLGVLLPAFIVMGIGGGITGVSNSIVAMSGVARNVQGVAAGIMNSSQRVGSAIGLALLITVATARTTSLERLHVSSPLALISGYRVGMIVSLCFAALTFVVALRLLPRQHKRGIASSTTDGEVPTAVPSELVVEL
jgi:EmrB/QacA subfamily drug resistance transporter